MRAWGIVVAAWAFLRTRRLARRLCTRADVERHQQQRLARWLRSAVPRVARYADVSVHTLAELPIVDKAALMSDFAAFNRPGITATEGWHALETTGMACGCHVGASTGTSGNRGLYVISERERWRWLGTIVAKTMPRLRRARVALVLPRGSSLYDAAQRSSMLELRFFDLNSGIAAVADGIATYCPDTLIAPPKVLRWLAEQPTPPRGLHQVFSAAEVLDPLDRAAIETGFGVKLREIYMATEGLLGVSCERGTMHLCEDTMAFEFEPVPGESGLVSPLITDFSRTTQIMARYRLNDLLRLSTTPCPCGSPLQAVAEIVGRADDMLLLEGAAGTVTLTPDIVRNAIIGADPAISDFRLVQLGPAELELAVPRDVPDAAAERALVSLSALLARLGAHPSITLVRPTAFPVTARKQRRVERRSGP